MKKNKIINIFGLFLIILILSYNVYFYIYDFQINFVLLNNADMVFLPTLFKDIFISGGSITTWVFSPAPYFLDMFLYFISFLIFNEYEITIPIFFTLQNILLIVVFILICKEFFKEYNLIIASFVYILVIMLAPEFMYTFSFTSAHHFLTFTLSLYWLYFVYRLYCRSRSFYIFIILILGALLYASDNFFLFVMVPSICCSGFLYLSKKLKLKHFFGFILLNILSYSLARIMLKLFVFNPVHHPFKFIFSSEQILNHLTQVDNAIPLFFKIIFLLSFIICIFIRKSRFGTLATFSVIATLINFIPLMLVNFPLTGRYLLMLYPFTIIVFILFLVDKSKFKILFLIPILLIASYFYTNNWFQNDYSGYSILKKDNQCVIDFLTKVQAKNGLSQYWQAKPIYIQTGIKIAQISGDLFYFDWITQKDWQQDKYDIVIIDNSATDQHYKINKQKIININGKPDINHKCPYSEILYYKKGLYIDEFLAKGQKSFSSKEITMAIGKKADDVMVVENGNKKGVATYGPYIKLKAGKYSFELVYSSLDGDDENIWDVATNSGKTILESGELKDTNGEFKSIIKEFELNSDGKIEVRTFYGGKGELKIKELTIYKDKK